jgi:hypothetical protein
LSLREVEEMEDHSLVGTEELATTHKHYKGRICITWQF